MDLKGAEIRNILELCMDIGARNNVPLTVEVPYYQRPYRWKKNHIESLIHDFYKSKEDDLQSEYFVGSVVLVKGNNNSERHSIVDGQQRITTVFLLNYLRFLLLRAYIEESIILHRINLEQLLNDFEECYTNLLGTKHTDKIAEMKKHVVEKLNTINEVDEQTRDEIYGEILMEYQKVVGLPEKDLTNIDKYKNESFKLLKDELRNETLALAYSRNSYNEKLKEALASITVTVSKDRNPEIHIIDGYESYIGDEDEIPIVAKYTSAIKNEFDVLKEHIFEEGKPFDNAKNMISAIKEMIENIKYCVIITGNNKDAYTLFEVLNDRALEVEDLELIKNLFFQEYCNNSNDDEEIIDQNIDKLDQIWGDEIFTSDVKQGHIKLISYLATIYFTANESVFTNKVERYRKILEEEYLRKKYNKNERPYSYVEIVNDIRIYQMIKIIIEEFGLPINNASNSAIKAECNTQKSITYKAFHLLNALKMHGVLPALVNLIIKNYVDKHLSADTEEIEVSSFRKYIRELGDDYQHSNCEYELIHKWAFVLWKTALYAKDYNLPRIIAKMIVNNVSKDKNNIESVAISRELQEKMEKEFDQWISEWQYGKSMTDLKAKVLFINLFETEKVDENLTINPSVHAFATDKLQLDHLEADKPTEAYMEKYFRPVDTNERREQYINSLGNFMILDYEDNIDKSNLPLGEALVYYKSMSPNHWLVNEIEEMLKDGSYSKRVNIAEKEFHIPNEAFFSERRNRLKKYFATILKRNLSDKKIPID